MFILYDDFAKISLSKEQILECEDFVNKSNSKKYYLDNRNANIKKVKQQELEGKLGEYAVSVLFNEHFNISHLLKPDFTIYSYNKKSWDADLPYKDYGYKYLQNIHVKTCNKESADRYGESWVFQMEDQLFTQEKHKDDWCAFVLYDQKENCFLVRGVVSLSILKEYNLFSEMKLDIHKGKKCAVYYEMLETVYTTYISDTISESLIKSVAHLNYGNK